MALVSDVLDEARVLLNDVGTARYTNAILLPIFKRVYKELQRRLIRAGYTTQKEITNITVTAGALSIKAGGGAGQLPTNFLMPITLFEAAPPGTAGTFVPMVERLWEPDEPLADTLDVWAYRMQEIWLRGSTQTRIVKVHYFKNLATITAASDPVGIQETEQYLASAVAAVAAFAIAQNPSRAEAMQSAAENDLEELIAYLTQKLQGIRVRRRAFRRPRWV